MFIYIPEVKMSEKNAAENGSTLAEEAKTFQEMNQKSSHGVAVAETPEITKALDAKTSSDEKRTRMLAVTARWIKTAYRTLGKDATIAQVRKHLHDGGVATNELTDVQIRNVMRNQDRGRTGAPSGSTMSPGLTVTPGKSKGKAKPGLKIDASFIQAIHWLKAIDDLANEMGGITNLLSAVTVVAERDTARSAPTGA